MTSAHRGRRRNSEPTARRRARSPERRTAADTGDQAPAPSVGRGVSPTPPRSLGPGWPRRRRQVDVRATDAAGAASARFREPSLRPDGWLRASQVREPAPPEPPTAAARMEQMYLNITPCQLYPRLRGTALHGALLSTFRSASAGPPALKASQARWYVAFTILSKRLAVHLHDCQKWRTSHFCRRQGIQRGSDGDSHNWENWLRDSVGASRAGGATWTSSAASSADKAWAEAEVW